VSDESRNVESLRAAARHGLRWVVLARPAVEITLMGSLIVLARLVTPTEFGHFAVASLVGALALVPGAAITMALVQREAVEREHLQTGFALAILAGVGLMVLTLGAAQVIILPIFGARTAALVRLSSVGAPISALGAVPAAILQRRLEFRRLSVIDVVSNCFRAFGTVGLALLGLQGTALVLGVLGGVVLAALLPWAWVSAPLPRLHRAAASELLAYARPACLAGISWTGFQNIDYAIVGARLGALQAGYYFRAYTLGVEYQNKVSQVMQTVGFPLLARARNASEMNELRGQMVGLLTLLMFPLLALLAILAPVAVPFFFSGVWKASIGPTQLLAIGGASALVINSIGPALQASGQIRAVVAFGWGHFCCYGLAVFAVSSLGLDAVAASAAVVHTAFVVVAYWLLLKEDRSIGRVLRAIWADVHPALIGSAAIFATVVPANMGLVALRVGPLPEMTIAMLLGGIVYALVLRTWFRTSWTGIVGFFAKVMPRLRSRRRSRVAGVGAVV
jgi:lipopolysaccharide exporter